MTNKDQYAQHLCFLPRVSGLSQNALDLRKKESSEALDIVKDEISSLITKFGNKINQRCFTGGRPNSALIPEWYSDVSLMLSGLMSVTNTHDGMVKLKRSMSMASSLPARIAQSRSLLDQDLVDLGSTVCHLGSSPQKCFGVDDTFDWKRLRVKEDEVPFSEVEFPDNHPEMCLAKGSESDYVIDSKCCSAIQDKSSLTAAGCPLDEDKLSPVTRDEAGVLHLPEDDVEIESDCGGTKSVVDMKSHNSLLTSCSLAIKVADKMFKVYGNGQNLVKLDEKNDKEEDEAAFWYKTTFVVMAAMISGLTVLVSVLLMMKCKCCWVIRCCHRGPQDQEAARPRRRVRIGQHGEGTPEEVIRLQSNGAEWLVKFPSNTY